MIINNVSQKIRKVISRGDYKPILNVTGLLEIPIGHMTEEEKAIYSLITSCEMYSNEYNYLVRRLKNSLRRLKADKYSFRSGFVVVAELNISSLIWRPYTPCLN